MCAVLLFWLEMITVWQRSLWVGPCGWLWSGAGDAEAAIAPWIPEVTSLCHGLMSVFAHAENSLFCVGSSVGHTHHYLVRYPAGGIP